MSFNIYKHNRIFTLESGEQFPGLEIAYHTFGEYSKSAKVIWICHTFTADSNPTDWWSELVGKGKLIDFNKYFIVCANIIGSCYGSTNPISINSNTNKSWYRDFPVVTIKDLVKAHSLLADYLCINKIELLIGASIGGFQAIEWAISENNRIKNLILIATNAKAHPWLIAFNSSQRIAIEADSSFYEDKPNGGDKGLKAARSIALISYRNQIIYDNTQKEDTQDKIDNYKADSYQRYQGKKFVNRFNAYSYYSLSKTLDTHNIGRKRISIEKALKHINAKTLIVAIRNDLLFSIKEQKFIAQNINNAKYEEIYSDYGHDGFLIESKQLITIINNFYFKNNE